MTVATTFESVTISCDRNDCDRRFEHPLKIWAMTAARDAGWHTGNPFDPPPVLDYCPTHHPEWTP